MKRTLALLLLFSLFLTPASASQALGWEVKREVTTLGPGSTVTTQILWGDSKSDYRMERFFTYTPNPDVTPQVVYGATVPTTATLTSMARSIEAKGNRVLGGANGDYFVMATGVPLGMVVTGGVLRSSSSYHYAVGFDQSGRAFVGKPELNISASFHGYDLTVMDGYNKGRDKGYALFNQDFGASTKTKGEGVNVVLRGVTIPEDYPPQPELAPQPTPIPPLPEGENIDPAIQAEYDTKLAEYAAQLAAYESSKEALSAWAAGLPDRVAALTIGGKMSCVVESVTQNNGAVSIPANRFVLTVGKSGSQFHWDALAALQPGETVTLSVSAADERWSTAASALGAYARILENGIVPDGLDATAAPRTALGLKEDGSVLLYAMDGRQPGYSVGASVTQIAKRLKELGCVDAVLFDGGGSTTFGTTGALADKFSIDNKPSDKAQRQVTNALFFVSNLQPTGTPGSLYLKPHSELLLSGARLELSAHVMDTAYYPLYPAASGITYTAQGSGAIEGTTLIAGAEKGEVTVTGSTGSGCEGTALYTVVDTPHQITLEKEGTGKKVTQLFVEPGETVYLTAKSTYYNLPLLSQDGGCYTWTCDSAIGTIDPFGTFTAGAQGGQGTITVTAGGKSVSVPVAISPVVHTLEDFEGENVTTLQTATALLAPTSKEVKSGYKSGEITYSTGEITWVSAQIPIPEGDTHFGFFLYGNDTNLKIEAQTRKADGSEETVTMTSSAPSGWRQLQVALPAGTVEITGLTFIPEEIGLTDPEIGQTNVETDTLHIDQLISANQPVYDVTAPELTLIVGNGQVTASWKDNVDKTFQKSQISLTLDGKPLAHTQTGNTLTAALPADTALHRVTLTVTDTSGNKGRAAWDNLNTSQGAPFADTQGHWAAGYIHYLSGQGIVNGSPDQSGNMVFRPGDNITRVEFCALLRRWLGVDPAAYAQVQMPFVDAAEIPAWAVGDIQALYALGIFAGSAEADGLHAHPNIPISRAQAFTLLGRVLPFGYPPPTQSPPEGHPTPTQTPLDAHQIPTWSGKYIQNLEAIGAVTGYEGYIRPLDNITRGEAAKLFSVLW